jgi:DNA-binding NarL/FixJ family response regulator
VPTNEVVPTNGVAAVRRARAFESREPCPELRSSRTIVLASEPLHGIAIKALLESIGLRAMHAESVARAGRLVTAPTDIVLWLADDLDGEALEEMLELRRSNPGGGLCLVVGRAESSALREVVRVAPERFAFLARASHPSALALLAALSRVARGRGSLDGAVLRQILGEPGNEPGELERLSGVEHEVLALLAQGFRNCEIARRLWKSEKTVEKHIRQVFLKLDLDRESAGHLDRRVAAARIFLSQRSPSSA